MTLEEAVEDIFQSTLPVRGATAEMHKIIVYFCKGCSVFGKLYETFRMYVRLDSHISNIVSAETGANLTGKACGLGVRS